MDDLFSVLQQADPKTLQMMVEAGLFDERSKPLDQQMGIGRGLMETPSAQGRTVGNAYVASSPLEHLSNAIRQMAGARMSGKAMGGMGELADKRGAGRLAYLNLIAQRMGQQASPADGALPGEPANGM